MGISLIMRRLWEGRESTSLTIKMFERGHGRLAQALPYKLGRRTVEHYKTTQAQKLDPPSRLGFKVVGETLPVKGCFFVSSTRYVYTYAVENGEL
jgi:hypothetical protein